MVCNACLTYSLLSLLGFQRSVPLTDLDTVSLPLMAQSLGSACPQITQNGSMFIGKEDCRVGFS